MKLLILTDIHGKTETLEEIVKKSGEVDFVLIAGDLTDFGPPRTAEKILDIVEEKAPVFAIPGNCDPDSVLEILNKRKVNIDRTSKGLGDYKVAGLGGSNETPFGTVREYSEEELKKGLKKAWENGENSILVSHTPPKNTALDLTSSAHVGSRAVKKFIEDKKPVLVATGHVHEARGDIYIGKTLIVNPGPAMKGHAAIINLNGKIEIEYLKVK